MPTNTNSFLDWEKLYQCGDESEISSEKILPGVSKISVHVIYRIRKVSIKIERKFFLRSK